MSNILKVQDLQHNKRNFGLIGLDLATGKIKQYAFLDKDCNFESSKLSEIDISSLSNCMLKTWINDPYTKRRDGREMLPEDIKYYVDRAVLAHKNYNRSNNFSNSQMSFNLKGLEVFFAEEATDANRVIVHGDYISPSNTIIIAVNKMHSSLTPKQKILERNVMLHEMGHLAVASIKMDTVRKRLYCNVGFNNFVYDLTPIFVVGDDVIYSASRPMIFTKHGLALEEVFNELECTWIDSEYIMFYPKYGPILHELSDGTFLKARHNQDFKEYYRVMLSIIPDAELAYKLLESMDISIQNRSTEEAGRAFTLLKKYENAKKK